MEATATQEQAKPQVITVGGSTNPLNIAIGGALILGAGYLAYNHFHNAALQADQTKQNDVAATDQPTNLANQIYAENRSGYTSDSKQVDLYNQITDYKATKDAYTKVSLGRDMLADTQPHVSSKTYQQILNILGIKGGSKKATSDTVKQATKATPAATTKAKWLVTKVDTRIRKTPKADSLTSSVLHFSKSNIIGSVPAKTTIGFVDLATLAKNGNKPFYDSKNDVYFLPVLVFDKKDLNKQYTVYIAASTIDEFDSVQPGTKLLKINESDYNGAAATAGINGLGSTELNLL